MNCPICKLDLNVLDLVSRHEHVELCLENGPSVVEVDATGRLIVKKTVPQGKQRNICPICDKTFHNLTIHFKKCALKFDVPPTLMLEHWERINRDSKQTKNFPTDLLDSFVAKSIKEGRDGEQVSIARALSLSISGKDPNHHNLSTDLDEASVSNPADLVGTILNTNPSSSSLANNPTYPTSTLNQVHRLPHVLKQTKPAPKKRYRLETASETLKSSNIALRIDRELAEARRRRYEIAILNKNRLVGENDDEVCIIPDQNELSSVTKELNYEAVDPRDRLFFKARLKDCDGSSECLSASCTNHEFPLTMEEFVPYSGASMHANPQTKSGQGFLSNSEQAPNVTADD